jgi:hypothetical protein
MDISADNNIHGKKPVLIFMILHSEIPRAWIEYISRILFMKVPNLAFIFADVFIDIDPYPGDLIERFGPDPSDIIDS